MKRPRHEKAPTHPCGRGANFLATRYQWQEYSYRPIESRHLTTIQANKFLTSTGHNMIDSIRITIPQRSGPQARDMKMSRAPKIARPQKLGMGKELRPEDSHRGLLGRRRSSRITPQRQLHWHSYRKNSAVPGWSRIGETDCQTGSLDSFPQFGQTGDDV